MLVVVGRVEQIPTVATVKIFCYCGAMASHCSACRLAPRADSGGVFLGCLSAATVHVQCEQEAYSGRKERTRFGHGRYEIACSGDIDQQPGRIGSGWVVEARAVYHVER